MSVAAAFATTEEMVKSFPLFPQNLGPMDLSRPYGACDPMKEAAEQRSTLEVYRYSTGFLQFATAAGANPSATIAVGASINLFDAGIGDPNGTTEGFPAGVVPSFTETDAFPTGAPVDIGFCFYAFGMTFQVLRPFRYDAVNNRKLYDPAVDEYEGRFAQAIQHGVSVMFTFGNTACQYTLGNPGHWGSMAGPRGAGVVSNSGQVNGLYLPFRVPICCGARDTTKQLTAVVTVGGTVQGMAGMGIEVVGNAINPLTASTTYFVPIQMQLLGIAIPGGPAACAPDDATVARVIAALQARGQLSAGK